MTEAELLGYADRAGVVVLVVRGQPAPQGSKRAFVNKATGRASLVESSKQGVISWRQAIVDRALETMQADYQARLRMSVRAASRFPLDGPLAVVMVFSFRRPRSHHGTGRNAATLKLSAPRRPAGPPDLSKLARSTEDALTDAGVWADDARVCEYDRLAKVWCGEDPDALDVPGATITIRQI